MLIKLIIDCNFDIVLLNSIDWYVETKSEDKWLEKWFETFSDSCCP